MQARSTLRRAPAAVVAALLLGGGAQAQTKLFDFQLEASEDKELGHAADGGADVDGDGVADVLVGDPEYASQRGRAAVWSGADGALLHVFEGDAPGGRLGFAVSFVPDLDGDGRADLAIGAPYDDQVGISAGAVQVRSGATGALLGELLAETLADSFGWAVDGLEDLDGDGLGDLIVGAPTAGEVFCCSTAGRGKAYVYSGADLAQGIDDAIREHANTVDHLHFGRAVSAAGDRDGDGFDDYAIGDPNDSSHRGRVWVHSGSTGGFLDVQEGLDAGPGQSANGLGTALSFAGDVDGDGLPDLVAGATGNPSWDSYVMVILGSGGTEILPSPNPGDHYGWSVDGAGDIDGDGLDEIAVGAPRHDALGVGTGRVLVHGRVAADDWIVELDLEGETSHVELGAAVAGHGDLTGDGLPELVVGATGQPSARVYSSVPVPLPSAAVTTLGTGCGGIPPGPPTLTAGAPQIGSSFQASVVDTHVFTPGLLLASPGPGTPLDLGAGCTAWVDPAELLILFAFSHAGSWTSPPIELPYSWVLTGEILTLQAVVLPTPGPLGLDLTNGVELLVGV